MDYGDYYWGLYRDYYRDPFPHSLLGGSWDLVSKVISPLIGVISNYKYSYLIL